MKFWIMRALVGLVVGLPWQSAAAQTPDEVQAVIETVAAEHGANGAQLVALSFCESSLRPWVVGDHGTSFGPFQINSLPTGLLGHFRAVGYSDPFDVWQSASYVARVAVGEWAGAGITLGRWTCFR